MSVFFLQMPAHKMRRPLALWRGARPPRRKRQARCTRRLHQTSAVRAGPRLQHGAWHHRPIGKPPANPSPGSDVGDAFVLVAKVVPVTMPVCTSRTWHHIALVALRRKLPVAIRRITIPPAIARPARHRCVRHGLFHRPQVTVWHIRKPGRMGSSLSALLLPSAATVPSVRPWKEWGGNDIGTALTVAVMAVLRQS